MVKLPMDSDRIDEFLKTQEQRRKQKRDARRLSHISEDELKDPAKQKIESKFLPDSGMAAWYEEPDVFVRERKQNEAPSRVAERPDLMAEWKPAVDEPSTLYIVELKKRLGKKALGQIITYYWAARNGTRVVDGDQEYSIVGDEPLVMVIGAIEYKTPYYDQVVEWTHNSLEFEDLVGIETIPLQPD